MSAFGSYVSATALVALGAPRRKSFFNSTAVVDSVLADVVIDQMLDWAVALGACRPTVALQAIATIFRDRDWEGPNAPNILEFTCGADNGWLIDRPPFHRAIRQSLSFAKHSKIITVKQLTDPVLRTALEEMCLEGFLYGLTHPKTFETWFASHASEQSSRHRALGVHSCPPATLDGFLADADKMLAGYQNEYGALSPIPGRLWADAQTVRPGLTR